MKKKIAIVATHPIQYQIPWFQALANSHEYEIKVYYGFIPDAEQQGKGFGIKFHWDIPMFEGYDWELLENRLERPELGPFFGSRLKNIRSVFKREKPDVILITGWNACPLLQALFAAIWLRIPTLVRGDSNAMKPRRASIRVLHRLLMRCYSAFLYVGRSNRDFYTGYGVKGRDLFAVPHFIDNDRFMRESSELGNVRQKWNIDEHDICFLYAGKLEKKKRITDLLAALQLIYEKKFRLHLLVVGDGELMSEARSIVKKQQLPVTFSGFLNQLEITQAYVASDCIVLPSDSGETWGLVINEAMACGLPAIVSDRVGCGPDLVKERITGFQFTFGDVVALAAVMQRFASNSQVERKSMGLRAQKLIVENYSIKAAVQGTFKAADHVLSKKCIA